MKRMLTGLMTVWIVAGMTLSAAAGAFTEYYDYPNPDGTYGYYFRQGVRVTVSEDWYMHTFVRDEEGGAAFYHTDSFAGYQNEGIDGGGFLLRICASANTDYRELPAFRDIGYSEEDGMNYYAVLPSDYPAYTGDEAVKEDYDRLWAQVDDVIDGIRLDGDEAGHEAGHESPAWPDGTGLFPDSSGDTKGTASSLPGGWQATEDIALTDEAMEAFEQASAGLDGINCTPAALLWVKEDGTGWCILCREEAVLPEREPGYVLMYIEQEKEEGAVVRQIRDLMPG